MSRQHRRLAVREGPCVHRDRDAGAETLAPADKLAIKVKIPTRRPTWSESVQLAGYDLPNNVTMALVDHRQGRVGGDGGVVLREPAAGRYTFTVNGAGQVVPRLRRPRPEAAEGQQRPPGVPVQRDHDQVRSRTPRRHDHFRVRRGALREKCRWQLYLRVDSRGSSKVGRRIF